MVQRVAILMPDATRIARSDLYLPALMQVLGQQQVELFLATGTHPAVDTGDRRDLLGDLAGTVQPIQHDCRTAQFTHLGETSYGNAIRINSRVVQADLIILTGRITNHYFAGFSGGPKALLPGVAAYETVLNNHKMVLDGAGKPNKKTINGKLHNNPVHQEMHQAAAKLPHEPYVLNTIVDRHGALAHLYAGGLEVHAKGCRQAQQDSCTRIEQPYDVAIVSCGGRPYDRSFMQALKAPLNWSAAVKTGGILIWVADCSTQRLDRFVDWFSEDPDQLAKRAIQRYELFAHNTILLRQLQKHCDVALVSPLDANTVEGMGFAPFAHLEDAVDYAQTKLGTGARSVVVPDGNITYAVCAGDP